MKSYRLIIPALIITAAFFSSCSEKSVKHDGGVYTGEVSEKGVPCGYGTWKDNEKTYSGFWKDGKKDGQGTLTYGKNKYRGGFKDDKFDGPGIMMYGDSVVYSGNWKEGRYHGTGTVSDSLGRKITADWEADSMKYGVRKDTTGTYCGTFDENYIPSGEGRYSYGDMQFYEGEWLNDKPQGFGIQLAPDGWLRVGEWNKGRFKGEVLNYTADRIYGIDIARYQHKEPIRWNELRITHLGHISKKKITGKEDYPVSFVYIKCTEGETVQNKYYKQDYKSARARGIRCGSYHFFSVHSKPEDQARNFLKHVKMQDGDFPPVLDLEPSNRDIRNIGGDIELFKRVRTWLHIVEEELGIQPILYINQMFVNKHMPYAPDLEKKYEVWIARYGEYKPDLHLVMWQIAPDGRVKGINGPVDINVFNGYRPAYDRYLRKKTYKSKLPDDKRQKNDK